MPVREHPMSQKLAENSIPEPNSGCLLWMGRVKNNGYGCLSLGEGTRRPITAHRAAYREASGPIPPGLCVCHKCDVRLCIEPNHLFLGTKADNSRDMVRKGRSLGGERHPQTKLSAEAVLNIGRDTRTQRAIAKEYGVSQSVISHVKTGKHWRSAVFVEVMP